jgi:hypothetical protein
VREMWRFPSWDGARKRSWLTLGGALPSLNSQQPLSRPSGCALQSPSACEVPVVVPLDRGARTAASRPGAELHRGRWGALPARVRSCTAAAGGRFLPVCGAAPRPLGGATCPGAELHVSSPPPGAGWRAACTKAVLADDALKQCQASQSHRRGRGCGCPLCQHTSSEVLRTTEIGCISPVLQVTAGRVVSDRHGCTLETLSRFQAPPYSAKVTPYSLPVSHRVDIAWSKEDTQKRVHCLRTRTYAEKPGLCIRNRNEITKRKKSLQI